MDMRLPASQLKNDDLPTLGLPTIATEGKAKGFSHKKKLLFHSRYYWLELHTIITLGPLKLGGIIRTYQDKQTFMGFFIVNANGFNLEYLLVVAPVFMDHRITSPRTNPNAT